MHIYICFNVLTIWHCHVPCSAVAAVRLDYGNGMREVRWADALCTHHHLQHDDIHIISHTQRHARACHMMLTNYAIETEAGGGCGGRREWIRVGGRRRVKLFIINARARVMCFCVGEKGTDDECPCAAGG